MDRYADGLAAVGRLLDSEGGGPLALLWVGDTITLLSRNPDGVVKDPLRRVLTREELESWEEPDCAESANLQRLSAGRADLLRTLGYELAADDLELVGLLEGEDRYQVRAHHHGRYIQRMYLKSTLAARWAESSEARASGRERWLSIIAASLAIVAVAMFGWVAMSVAPLPSASIRTSAAATGPAATEPAATEPADDASVPAIDTADDVDVAAPITTAVATEDQATVPVVTSIPVVASPSIAASTQGVVVTANGLRLRAQPRTTGALVTGLTLGTKLEVIGEPVIADGFAWLEVRTPNGSQGWVVDLGVS